MTGASRVAGLLACLAMTAGAAAAQPASPPATLPDAHGPVSARATADKTEVTVGEPFVVEVSASGPPGTSFEFLPGTSGEGFELRTPPAREGEAPPPPGVKRYEATVYSLSQAEIPPIPVRYRLGDGTPGETAAGPVVVKVGSLLPKDPAQQKLADIRGPLPLAIGAAFWVAAAVASLALAALIAWLVRRRRRVPAQAVEPVELVPPDVEAERELDALAASGLLDGGEYRGFYIGLTVIAKRYLERRLAAPVLEMTTAETLAFLRGQPSSSDLLTTVRDVAEAADRIKFARADGLRAEAARHLAAVRTLVRTLEARLAPPVEPAGREKVA